METTQQNAPLTDAQKLVLRTMQNKLLLFEIQSNTIRTAINEELTKISKTNAIDFSAFQLNDDLDLVPKA